jgi:hypothetical protein
MKKKHILFFIFILSWHFLFCQIDMDTNQAIAKSKLFSMGEFDQFDTIGSLYIPSIVKSDGFKDVLFIKIKARNIARLMLCAIGKKEDSLRINSDSGSLDAATNKKYRELIFKKYYRYDNITSNNIENFENLFGNDVFVNNSFVMECDYILAYTSRRCYLLKGFAANQFKQFFAECIINRQNIVSRVSADRSFEKGNYLDVLDNLIRIDGVNLRDFYTFFVLQKKVDFPQCKPCADRMVIDTR